LHSALERGPRCAAEPIHCRGRGRPAVAIVTEPGAEATMGLPLPDVMLPDVSG